MPTYTVHARPGALTADHKAAIADAITTAHAEHTGAPRSFVQTIFTPVAAGDHFIGAQPADPRSVWVHGHIRDGRTPDARTGIALAVTDAISRIAGIPREHIWVYLTLLAHTDMVEFGSLLPAPGGEAAWIDALPASLRQRLLDLG